MLRINFNLLYCLLVTAFSACNYSGSKTSSKNDSAVSGAKSSKKDSVINNSQKNYGGASISQPCEQSLLQIIQTSDSYKKATAGKLNTALIYSINWVKAAEPKERVNGQKITNGLVVDVKEHNMAAPLCSYLYNNEDGKLYLLNKTNKYEEDLLKVDEKALKKIRNSCYWGVASNK